VCHYEKSGIFSARSDVSTETGDNCCLGGDRTGRSDTRAQEKEWCELWRIKVPSNMCIPVPVGEAPIATGDVPHHKNMALDKGVFLVW